MQDTTPDKPALPLPLFAYALLYGGIFTIVLAVAIALYFSRTRPGLRMTVVAEDHQIAQSMGK